MGPTASTGSRDTRLGIASSHATRCVIRLLIDCPAYLFFLKSSMPFFPNDSRLRLTQAEVDFAFLIERQLEPARRLHECGTFESIAQLAGA